MNYVRLRAGVIGLTLAFLAVCGAQPAPPVAAGFRVVAEFYPLYVTLLNLTAGVPGVQVANLVPPPRSVVRRITR